MLSEKLIFAYSSANHKPTMHCCYDP